MKPTDDEIQAAARGYHAFRMRDNDPLTMEQAETEVRRYLQMVEATKAGKLVAAALQGKANERH